MQRFSMKMYVPNNPILPLTKTKLNFYLAQRSRLAQGENNTHQYSQRSPGANLGRPTHSNLDLHSLVKRSGERTSNGPSLQSSNSNQCDLKNCNDSLDSILTERNSYSSRAKQMYPECQSPSPLHVPSGFYSPTHKQNGPEGDVHLTPAKHRKSKKVHWDSNFKQLSVFPFKLDDEMSQISHNLSCLNYEINSNFKKIEGFKRMHQSAERASKQEALKRANLKYSLIGTEGKQSNLKPRVEYLDNVYRDPRFLMWRPME